MKLEIKLVLLHDFFTFTLYVLFRNYSTKVANVHTLTSLFNHFLNIGLFIYGSVIHNKIRATHVFKAIHDIKSLFQEAHTLTRCGCLSTQLQHSS